MGPPVCRLILELGGKKEDARLAGADDGWRLS
jgi:hypothetical protein